MISDHQGGLKGWWGHVQRIGDSHQNEEDAGWDFGCDSSVPHQHGQVR